MGSLEEVNSYPVEYVIGIDEVGTGAWAGPFVVSACACRQGWSHPLVKDSKKFFDDKSGLAHSKRKSVIRDVLELEVEEYWITSVAPRCLNVPHSMGSALVEAMGWLVDASTARYENSLVVVDGSDKQGLHERLHGSACLTYLTKADQLVPAVAAASIFAKVFRDSLMIEASKEYKYWGFAKNKGYGTKKHITALERYGACPIHRWGCSGVREHADSRKSQPPGKMRRNGNHRREKQAS